MPLSENEQRLLEQMERALYAEDPKLATTLRGADPRRRTRRRIAVASLAFALGIVLLMTGLILSRDNQVLLLVSVVGFVVMLGSAFVAVSSFRQGNSGPDLSVVGGLGSVPTGRGRRPQRGNTAFMARLEERWNRRRDERDR